MEKETKRRLVIDPLHHHMGKQALVGQTSCDFNREKFMLTIQLRGRIRHYSSITQLIIYYYNPILSHALTLLRS